jgi:hypothetical protein
MHRIDADGHVDNLFSMGTVEPPALATQVDADWCNDVQENLCQLIESFGIVLVNGDYTQLTKALKEFTTWALARAGDQTISKAGGKLQIGTSTAHDLECLRAGIKMLALTASGIDANGYTLVNLAGAILQSLTSDPTLTNGRLWHRSDLAKLRTRLNGVTENLATESWEKRRTGWIRVDNTQGSLIGASDITSGFVTSIVRTATGTYQFNTSFNPAAVGLGVTAIKPSLGGANADVTWAIVFDTATRFYVETYDADGEKQNKDFFIQINVP